MTNRISLNSDINEAKQSLLEKFTFVGLVEKFDESLILLKNELKINNFCINYEKENVKLNIDYKESDFLDDPKIRNKIYQNNQLDIELYNFAINVVFKKYKDRFGKNLQKETKFFRKSNLDFQFNKNKKLLAKTYRLLIYKNIEHIIKVLFHK